MCRDAFDSGAFPRGRRAELGATHESVHAGLVHLSEAEFGGRAAVNLKRVT
jgi:hypothetical protein